MEIGSETLYLGLSRSSKQVFDGLVGRSPSSGKGYMVFAHDCRFCASAGDFVDEIQKHSLDERVAYD